MSKGPLTARERELKAQLEEAEETIRQMRDARTPDPLRVYRHITFTPTDAAVVKCLSATPARPISATRIRSDLDAANLRLEGCATASVYVAICRLRRKLKRAADAHELEPITVDTVYGHGFAMTSRSIANLNALLIQDNV